MKATPQKQSMVDRIIEQEYYKPNIKHQKEQYKDLIQQSHQMIYQK